MKIAIYTRVSTEDQSVDAQLLELRPYVTSRGWTIAGEFTDVMSGSKAKRPGLGALVEACKAGGIEAICVVKLDRLGRSLLNVVNLIDELDIIGVATICTSQGIDTRSSNPCGRVTYQILAAVSEFERNLIRERTKAGLAVARAAGKRLGRVSKKMPGADGRCAVVAAWRIEGGVGGYDELGRRLGGVSRATAMRVDKKCGATAVPEI